jgi:GT2 family glycosyltransferase
MKFAGFIITYNRPNILKETIEQVFAQTLPPEKLWIIDNSEGNETGIMIDSLSEFALEYIRMGYNAGPAGAAAKGLEIVGNAGYDWIYWGDDNDPPFTPDCFERLLKISKENPFCGILGSVGQFFDREKGVIKRVQTELLKNKSYISVDYVAGNMSMLVNREIVKQGVVPEKELFFGFEELDFCLKVKRKGFEILVDCGLFLEAREIYNKLNFEIPAYKRKDNLVREYYSLRNLLMISDTFTLNNMRRKLILKWMAKSLYGFRYGSFYGFENAKMISLAFYHYFRGVKGKTLDL